MKKMKWITGLFIGLMAAMPNLNAKQHTVYDYIVVGGGTAGCTFARKATDDGKTKVLVLEAGVDQSNNPEVELASGPALVSSWNDLLINPKFAETFATPGFVPFQVYTYSQGIGWGGSSMHNFQAAVRGTPDFYNRIAILVDGNADASKWAYGNMLTMMLAFENFIPCGTTANPSQRSVGGGGDRISINQAVPLNPGADPLAAALAGPSAGNAGFLTDYNDPSFPSTTGFFNIGFSAVQIFATAGSTPCSVGHRSYAANTFINPNIVDSKGNGLHGRLLRFKSNAYVSRVLFKGKKAIGVEFVYGSNASRVLRAYGKKIILCAGAINSPAILQRSGIGDPAIMNPLGIKTRVANRNVGANLIDQYGPSMVLAATTTANPSLGGFLNASGVTAVAGFTYPADSTRRLQVVAQQIAPGLARTIAFIMEPRSRGSVQIVSTNPLVQPQLLLNMFSDGDVTTPGSDANLAVASYYLVQQAVGAGNVIFPTAAMFAGGPSVLLSQAAKSTDGLTVTSHICGTTRLSANQAEGVVDTNLDVWGVKNLKVVDLGVAPISPDGNPTYFVYTLAEKAAQIEGFPVPPGD